MHELSITEHLLEHCISEAKSRNASRIRVIRLCIGQLRGIVPDCIQIYLDMLSEGTVAEGAKLITHTIPAGIECPECGYSGEIHGSECPGCGGWGFRLVHGREFYIDSIEVE